MKGCGTAAVLSLWIAAATTAFGCSTQAEIDHDEGSIGGDTDAGDEAASRCTDLELGSAGLRRLTAAQYDNTVRDLLGVVTRPSEQFSFSPDERIGPFTSNGIAPVGDLQVEQYMAAAETIAASFDLDAHLPCASEGVDEAECADQFIAQMGQRVYRRPLEPEEHERFRVVYERGRHHGDFADGIRLVVQGMLQSPFFLYHIESGSPVEEELVALDGWSLASRLSYFLWNTMPDDVLFSVAASGELSTQAGLMAQFERMLDDPRAEAAIATFHLQWLGIEGLTRADKDERVYPLFERSLADAMLDETSRFSSWVVREGDGTLDTLLTAEFTLTDDSRLLALYGATLPDDHVRGAAVPLPEGQRAGLLTHASLLASHAHPDQTSPIHRGVMIRQNFFCQTLPPPPPNVDDVPPDPDPEATTRERFDQHTSDPSCSGCHNFIDPLGFGLENYDAIGAFRTKEGARRVDATGELVGTDVDGPFEGGVELAHRLVASQQVRRCVTRQWFRFAFGRGETLADACTLEALDDAFARSGSDVRVLLREIVASEAFRHRRLDPPRGE